MQKAISLTAALEDYLEAILHLCRFDKAARSRDIAESLNVHKSTVTAALKSLSQLRLINYSPYEAVTLTPEGRKFAEDVAKRHAALRDFFIGVLRVDGELAEKAACGMEHAVPREIVEKLADFAVSMAGCPRLEPNAAAEPCPICQRAGADGAAVAVEAGTPASLDAIVPGGKAKVVSVKGDGQFRKRLSEMGLVRGALVQVERVAPLGDPMEVRVRNYHLSLRKEEAGKILVETVEG